MAFKQNLPAVVALSLLVAGLAALVFFLQTPEEERVREAAAKYGATLGALQDVQVRGHVADITVAGRSVLFAEFALVNGTWTFSKDLGAEFQRLMQDPATSAEILKRLAQRISDRFNMNVTVREGIGYRYAVARDAQGLVGQVDLTFSYPKVGEKQMAGRYVEIFRYEEGSWRSQGPGSLMDKVPAPQPR